MDACLYRTRVTHLRRAPVHHYFEHPGYSWYVDVDRLPSLPRWLRPFARFDPADHLDGAPGDTLRDRVDAFLRGHGVDLTGGRVTALLQARVLGYVFNPVTLYWCHDADGVLRHVVMEMHNTRGGRHAYLLPPGPDGVSMTPKQLRVSPFNGADGHYLVRAPHPDDALDITVSLHRNDEPAFIATVRGTRRPATLREVLRLQFTAPLAPLMTAVDLRIQHLTLWLRRVPVVRSDRRARERDAPSTELVAHAARSR
ncbi:DUF1365 family protein [Mycolicibacterium flavescens]|uniref:DUF1365 domain-containing protein n=1 Tax=Mycolicibacterium flavescens TaxID=1776 RepID=A0A1E3RE09_MYCFV|nr:DUF1365 family protein [Mycolicibacterium flavescens]MCV7280731.1 DUF1365 family protein [Mycolicibacterium flavescens]ODQ88079.1 hypothetical protein BHQ18_21110 [Mycolicibacterium flavescens]